MIIDPRNPMKPLDKYGNPQKMTNPYGTFKTSLQGDELKLAKKIFKLNSAYKAEPNTHAFRLLMREQSVANHIPEKYPTKLLMDAYQNLHPRQGVTVNLNNQIATMERKELEYYANEAGKYLKQIKDVDPVDLSPERVWNLPNIVKYREYVVDSTGRSHISPDQFLDLKGKSDKHIKWDADYWYKRAIGVPDDDKTKLGNATRKYDNALQGHINNYLYHSNKYAYYQTYPWIKHLNRNKMLNIENNFMTAKEKQISKSIQYGSKSWLQKIKVAQFWLKYHQQKLYWFKYYHPYVHTRYGWRLRAGITIENKLVARWQNSLNRDIQHKNNDFHYYQEYITEYKARMHQEWLEANWAQINADVNVNMQNNLTSIYRADGTDATVVAVAEISPTEEVSLNAPTKSIDDGMPQTDMVQTSGEQLNGQYMIYLPSDWVPNPNDMAYGDASPSYNQRVSQYNTLKNWARGGDLLAIRGFNTWHSILITDIERTADQTSTANGLSLQITFQDTRLAHIKFAKNTKAPARPMQGKNNRKSRTLVIKPNNTFWGLSKRFGGTVKQWEQANPHARATDLQIGHKLNVPQGAKV